MNINRKFSFINCFDVKALPVSLYLSLAFSFLYNPLGNTGFTKFNRILGQATASNVNISRVISHFYIGYLLIIPICFLITFFLVSYIYKNATLKRNDTGKTISLLNCFTIVSFLSLIVAYINKFSDAKLIFSPSVTLPCVVVVSVLFYLLIIDKIALDMGTLKWGLIVAFIMTFPAAILLKHFSVEFKIPILYLILVFSVISILTVYMRYGNRAANLRQLQIALIPLAFTLLAVSIYLELVNILNQYDIFLTHKTRGSMLIYLGAALIGVILYFILKKRTIAVNFSWERYYYPTIILSLCFIVVQPQLQMAIGTDLFEAANGGTAISQLFLFGKLPIMESYSGHMLSDSIWGILYGVLNNDSFGAFFSPYNVYVLAVVSIILYFLLKSCFEKDFAFIMTVLFPFIGGQIIWSHVGFISILALVYLLKLKKTFAYFVFWITLAGSCLYQLDTGVAYGVGSVISLICVCLLKQERINFKKLILSFGITAGGFLGVFVSICIIKQIPVLNRIKEFIAISLSNQNWAYSNIGNPSLFSFFFVYVLIPSVTVGMLLLLVGLIKREKTEMPAYVLAIILAIGFAYITNIPRALVRHNLNESNYVLLLFTAPLFLSLALAFMMKKNRRIVFSSAFFIIMLTTSVVAANTNISTQTLISNSINRFGAGDITTENVAMKKVQRVDTSEEMKQSYLSVVNQLNKMLLPGETYIDFTNQTLLYALSGRQNPVYVNQSPGHLSGEFTQEQFIVQVEAMHEQTPIAILPRNTVKFGFVLDGIQNSFRYYKVAEYMWQNFTPLGVIGDYAIWCRNKRISDYKSLGSIANSITISKNNFQNLTCYDAQIQNDNGDILIIAGAKDPQLSGLENLFKDILPNSREVEFGIEYTSSVSGNVQLFYTQQKDEYFSESCSILQQTQASGWLYFQVPRTEFSKFRLDIPNGSNFKIKEITLRSADKLSFCDYGYAKLEEAHTYNLGAIPYLWGNLDNDKAYKNEKIVDALTLNENLYKIDLNKIPKDDGNYLLLEINAQQDSSATVSFGTNATGDFLTLNTFTFSTYSGNHIYLLRVSCDFYWYSKEINSFMLNVGNNVSVRNVQILRGD